MSNLMSEHRVFPRLFAIFYMYITWDVWQWIKMTPGLTEYQHFFAMAVVAGAVGYFNIYVGNRIK